MGVLDGHVAIISGGAGDIGRAIALELASRGAAVAIGDIRPAEDAKQVLEAITERGVRSRYDCIDVADDAAVDRWVAAVEADLGTGDLIIPNAAIVTTKNSQSVTPAEWEREIAINLHGAFFLARAGALRLIHHHRPGRIVFTGSWAANAPHPRIPAYSVSKAGLRMLCQCMALEFGPHDILVNEVAPGYVDAGLTGRLFEANPGRREASRDQVPIGRLIEPGDVALQVAHLCDPANRHTTGSVVLMDGGLSLVNPSSGPRPPQ